MKNPRRAWIVMGVVSSLGAVGAFALLTAMESLTGMMFLDLTSALRNEGLITQERWDRLIDSAAPNLRMIFRVGTLIPVGLMVVGLVQFYMARRAGRGNAPERATMVG